MWEENTKHKSFSHCLFCKFVALWTDRQNEKTSHCRGSLTAWLIFGLGFLGLSVSQSVFTVSAYPDTPILPSLTVTKPLVMSYVRAMSEPTLSEWQSKQTRGDGPFYVLWLTFNVEWQEFLFLASMTAAFHLVFHRFGVKCIFILISSEGSETTGIASLG